MSRRSSFLSDYAFPVLLMVCGALGLAVINLISLERQRAATTAAGTSRASQPAPPEARRPFHRAPARAR